MPMSDQRCFPNARRHARSTLAVDPLLGSSPCGLSGRVRWIWSPRKALVLPWPFQASASLYIATRPLHLEASLRPPHHRIFRRLAELGALLLGLLFRRVAWRATSFAIQPPTYASIDVHSGRLQPRLLPSLSFLRDCHPALGATPETAKHPHARPFPQDLPPTSLQEPSIQPL